MKTACPWVTAAITLSTPSGPAIISEQPSSLMTSLQVRRTERLKSGPVEVSRTSSTPLLAAVKRYTVSAPDGTTEGLQLEAMAAECPLFCPTIPDAGSGSGTGALQAFSQLA